MKGKIYLPNISHSNFQVEVLLKELLSMLQFKVPADILKIAMLDISKWMQNH